MNKHEVVVCEATIMLVKVNEKLTQDELTLR